MKKEEIGIYLLTEDFKIENIITKDGIITYDPFEREEVIPIWGTNCTTFWALEPANRKYLIDTLSDEALKEIQFQVFWIFWFCDDGDLTNTKELMFFGNEAKENSYKMLNIFNQLLLTNVKRLIESTKNDYESNLKDITLK